MNDILIVSKNKLDRIKHIKEVLSILKVKNQSRRVHVYKNRDSSLGYLLTSKGIEPQNCKVEEILN